MKEPQPLDFEKPIVELQRRLQEIRDHSDEHALDFDAEVEAMEAKIETTRREIYGNLSAWQRVQIARHTQRPFALDYVERCFTNWNELHGDRLFGDDKAMPCGIAMLGEQRCIVITNQKGRNTKENVMRNFGCAHPEGYRKALRLMQLGEKFNLPVISLIDTPGAYPGIGSEERHIAEAIATAIPPGSVCVSGVDDSPPLMTSRSTIAMTPGYRVGSRTGCRCRRFYRRATRRCRSSSRTERQVRRRFA